MVGSQYKKEGEYFNSRPRERPTLSALAAAQAGAFQLTTS